MRKLLQCNLLAVGIVVLVYSLVMPVIDAAEAHQVNYLMYFSSSLPTIGELFAEAWMGYYYWLTIIGGIMVLAAVLLLVIFRKSNSRLEIMPATMISGGTMLEVAAFLQAWSAAVEAAGVTAYLHSDSVLTDILASSTLDAVPEDAWLMYTDTLQTTGTSPWRHLWIDGYKDQLWLVILGAVLIVIGIICACVRKPKEEPAVEESAEAEAPEEIPEEIVSLREDVVIRLYCTVMDIRGDYALVKYDDTGIESEVAIALLPFGIDVGDKLKYENYEFTQI